MTVFFTTGFFKTLVNIPKTKFGFFCWCDFTLSCLFSQLVRENAKEAVLCLLWPRIIWWVFFFELIIFYFLMLLNFLRVYVQCRDPCAILLLTSVPTKHLYSFLDEIVSSPTILLMVRNMRIDALCLSRETFLVGKTRSQWTLWERLARGKNRQPVKLHLQENWLIWTR